MDNSSNASKGGIGAGFLIFAIFLVLKILGDNGNIKPISWLVSQPGWGGWDVVFFPLWIGPAVILGIIFIAGVIIGISEK
jgi:hypothetical protein